MFLIEVWVLVLERLGQFLSIPGAICQSTADWIRTWDKEIAVIPLGVLTLFLGIILTVGLIVSFSRDSTASPAFAARIGALEAENAQLKARPTPPVNPLQSVAVLAPDPIASPGPIAVFQILESEIGETKAELVDLEAELKAAKAKPGDAERELSEIQNEVNESRATLKEQEKELKAAQKAISAK